MPFVIDVACGSCGHTWEAWLPNSEAAIEPCPECGGQAGRVSSMPLVTKCHDPQVRSEVLKKRSLDHSRRTAGETIERVRARHKLP